MCCVTLMEVVGASPQEILAFTRNPFFQRPEKVLLLHQTLRNARSFELFQNTNRADSRRYACSRSSSPWQKPGYGENAYDFPRNLHAQLPKIDFCHGLLGLYRAFTASGWACELVPFDLWNIPACNLKPLGRFRV